MTGRSSARSATSDKAFDAAEDVEFHHRLRAADPGVHVAR